VRLADQHMDGSQTSTRRDVLLASPLDRSR
jgi:hypothetical protein